MPNVEKDAKDGENRSLADSGGPNAENDRTCPACGARVGEPCDVPIGGVNTAGWTHDARILAPVIADLSTRPIPPAERDT